MGAEPPSQGPPLGWEQGRGLPPTLGCSGGEQGCSQFVQGQIWGKAGARGRGTVTDLGTPKLISIAPWGGSSPPPPKKKQRAAQQWDLGSPLGPVVLLEGFKSLLEMLCGGVGVS